MCRLLIRFGNFRESRTRDYAMRHFATACQQVKTLKRALSLLRLAAFRTNAGRYTGGWAALEENRI